MIKRQSVKKNLFFQLLYQFIILVIPLVIAPYLTRTLGDTQIGIYTYTYTIAYYFVIIGMLGVNKYGQRLIASSTDDDSLRRNFWSLFAVHEIFSIVSTCIFFVVVLLFGFENSNIYLIQGIFVASAIFDITWLFYGLENFQKIVVRNAILKIAECVLIFVFVKSSNDLGLYALIKSVSIFIGQVMMLPFAVKNIKPIKFTKNDMVHHLKPLLIFSIFVIAAMMYTIFDKTLVGIFCGKEEVAYYEYSNKIVEIPKTFAMILGGIIFPKACLAVKEERLIELKKFYKLTLIFTFYICFGAIFAFFALSDDLSLLYYGDSFIKCGDYIKYLSPIILLISFCNIIESIYLIPKNKEVLLTISIVVGALFNVILSLVLVQICGVYGAIIGSISGELIKLVIQFIICRKEIDFKITMFTILPFVISGFVMYFSLLLVKNNFKVTIISFIIECLIGFIIYSSIIGFYYFIINRDSEIKNWLFKKIRRH